jgi:group II intron reverse transcriptase/maturase
VYIPKTDGRQRPLGIAALEDKIVQGAVAEVMNAIYEEDFLGFSYGFRPGRNQHQALDALAVAIGRKKVNWVLDADIRSFFDVIDRAWMRRFIEHRITDRRLRRLIEKWLNAGVMEDGKRTYTETGTPQGATISPLLANIFMHYVFDLWANQWRRRKAHGDVILVRYADDIVVGFQHRWEAERFRAELSERMGRFGLELHPEKTRLIEFGRFAAGNRQERGEGRPETFDFLGFTHICGKARNGKFLLVRHTIKKRMRQTLQRVKGELKRRMHNAVREQGRWLRSVVRGYFAYHAVPTNLQALGEFRTEVVRWWLKMLRRRSQKHRLTWRRFNEIVDCWLPRPKPLHPFPEMRFAARTQGRSRMQ